MSKTLHGSWLSSAGLPREATQDAGKPLVSLLKPIEPEPDWSFAPPGTVVADSYPALFGAKPVWAPGSTWNDATICLHKNTFPEAEWRRVLNGKVYHYADASRWPTDPGWYVAPLESALWALRTFKSGQVLEPPPGRRYEVDGKPDVFWRQRITLYALKVGGVCVQFDPRPFDNLFGDKWRYERHFNTFDGRGRYESWCTEADGTERFIWGVSTTPSPNAPPRPYIPPPRPPVDPVDPVDPPDPDEPDPGTDPDMPIAPIPRDQILDALTWLRNDVYTSDAPGAHPFRLVNHPLDDEGIAAWLCDSYESVGRYQKKLTHQQAKDYVYAEIRKAVGGQNPGGGDGGVIVPPGDVQPLRVEGTTFRLPDGRIWKYRGVTAFTALEDYAASRLDKVEAFCKWARTLTPEPTLRVFGMWSVTGFDPRRTPAYYEDLSLLADVFHEQGCRLHFVAFTDQVTGSSVLMSRAEQDAHLQKCIATLRSKPNVLLEIVNEDFKNGNMAARFPREWFAGVLSTRSSWPDGQSPATVGSVLDFTTEHTPRTPGSSAWSRKAKNLLETSVQGVGTFPASGKPAIGGEPQRIGDGTPRECADYFALAELVGAGACVHGSPETLQRCNLPTPQEQERADAVKAVWTGLVPTDAQLGSYARGPNSDCPLQHIDRYNEGAPFNERTGALRTFAMKRGNKATVIALDPGPEWTARPQGGWRIDVRTGPQGQIFLMSK